MALIETAADIKQHNGAVNHDIELKSVKSFIDDAIDLFLIPAIGRTSYNGIVNARLTLTPEQAPAFTLLQKACVGFFLAAYAVSGAVVIDGSGISVRRGPTVAPASDKKLMALRKDSLDKGYAAIEQLIIYLEEFIVNFPTYQNSTERKRNRSLLINTSAEFQAAGVNIGNSAQLYQVLRTYQEDAERTYINRLLGDNLNTLIRSKISSGVPDETYDALIREVQRPVATFTLLEAIPYMAVSIDATGIYQLSETVGGISGNVENRSSAEVGRLQTAMYRLQIKGEMQLESLRKWIAKNKSQFIDYTIPEEVIINNNPDSNTYFL
jgi:hypothetical protein